MQKPGCQMQSMPEAVFKMGLYFHAALMVTSYVSVQQARLKKQSASKIVRCFPVSLTRIHTRSSA